MRKVFSVAAAVAVASNSRTDAVLLRRAEVVPNPTLPGGSSDGADPADVELSIVPGKNAEASDVGAPESSSKPRKSKKKGQKKSKKCLGVKKSWWKGGFALGAAGAVGYLARGGCPVPPPVPVPTTTMPTPVSTGAPMFGTSIEPTVGFDTSLMNATIYDRLSSSNQYATVEDVFHTNPFSTDAASYCNTYDNKPCNNFWTYDTMLKEWSAEFEKFPSKERAFAELSAFASNVEAETGDYSSCEEKALQPKSQEAMDGTAAAEYSCPTESGEGCSAGKIAAVGDEKVDGAYLEYQLAQENWKTFTCKNKAGDPIRAPQAGCFTPGELYKVDGDAGENCFFGRGGLQITGAAHYSDFSNDLNARGFDVDLCEQPGMMCKNPEIAYRAAAIYWKNKNADDSWCKGNECDFNKLMRKIGARDQAAHPKRVQGFKDRLDFFGVEYEVRGTSEWTEPWGDKRTITWDNVYVKLPSGEATGATSAAATPSSAPSPAAVHDAARAAQSCYEKSSNCNSDHCPSGLNPVLVGEPGSECRCGQDWNDVVAQSGSDIHRCGSNWLQCSQEGHTAYGATPSAGHCRCGSDWSAANAGQVGCIYQRPSGEPGSGRRLRGAGLRGAESS